MQPSAIKANSMPLSEKWATIRLFGTYQRQPDHCQRRAERPQPGAAPFGDELGEDRLYAEQRRQHAGRNTLFQRQQVADLIAPIINTPISATRRRVPGAGRHWRCHRPMANSTASAMAQRKNRKEGGSVLQPQRERSRRAPKQDEQRSQPALVQKVIAYQFHLS